MRKANSGPLLMLYLWLVWVPVIYALGTGDSQDVSCGRAFTWTAIYAFLAWRVWHGGRVAWILLVLLSGLGVLLHVIGTVWPWDASVLWDLISSIAQLAILLSRPVRNSATGTSALP